jgi:hypothetical protein
MKKTVSKIETPLPKTDGNLAVEVDWSDVEPCDVISLYACKRKALEEYAKANPKKTVSFYARDGVSCDFGELRRVVYFSAVNSSYLVCKLAERLRNGGFTARLDEAMINEDWTEEAIIRNGKVMWDLG